MDINDLHESQTATLAHEARDSDTEENLHFTFLSFTSDIH